ncbi:MAG: epoxyqueuosine reductase QueH [Deltaproteobacteria bacterium]|nr:epoxyqueuosine reductase QueH [Deltaproteobacteria bacterium]
MEPTVKKEVVSRPRMLVHMCCGPCSIIPLKAALRGKCEVWGFFHNPNIHPYSEFLKRLSAVKRLASYLSIDLICDEKYRPTAFIKAMKASLHEKGVKFPPKGSRCSFCYSARLEKTALSAVANGFDSFTSSLLYSTSQDHEEVKRVGSDLGKKYGIPFYYEDFRKGWQEGIDTSKEMGLYRQKYCGCVYSKIERYSDKKTKQNNLLQYNAKEVS